MSKYNIILTFQRKGLFGGISKQDVHCPVSGANAKEAIHKARLLCNKAGYTSKVVREQINGI